MAQSLWIPYLTDNIYRLTGLGTHADITQLRQAVRKIDSGQQVGIKPLVPFSKLLGDAELANLPNILQQVSSDPVKHLCHKLMWFPTLNVDNSQNQDTNEIRATIQSTYSRSRVEYFHSIFILELLQFLASGKETHLKNCIEKLSSFYNHQKFEGYVRLLVEQIRQGTLSNFADVLEEAQAAVASSILEFAVDTSLEALSTGDFDRGRSLLKLVVESPLDDDWEDAALTRVNQHVSPILSTIREITRQTDSWSPQFKDPISQEYAQVEALADLLRGRVLAVREWDLILQQWTDKKAILMCNYAVESVNEFATVIERANLTLRHHSPQMIQELRKRLENAEKVIQQALQTKVSEQTRQHLNKMLNETHELITRIPPTPANAQDIHTRNHDTILNPRKSNVSKAFPSGGRFINTADRHGRLVAEKAMASLGSMADRHGQLVAEEAMASLGLVLAGLERAAELPRHEQIHLFQKLSDHLEAVEKQILNALDEDGLSGHVRQRLLQSLEWVRNLRAKVPDVSTVDYTFAPFESCVVELVKRIVFAFFLILVGGLISLILSLFESCSK
jgi:hypothetical protein